MFARLLALFAILATVAAQASWQLTNVAKVTSLFGVTAIHANEAFGAVMDNGLGNGVAHTGDYGITSDFVNVGFMNMDTAFTSDNEVGAVVGVGGIYITPNFGANYTRVDNLHGVSQNIEPFSSKGFGATGSFVMAKKSVSGVAVSKDAGNTWELSDINMPDAYPARYGAFPSENTWYVSSGMWPDSGVTDFTTMFSRRLYLDAKKEPKFVTTPLQHVGDDLGYTGGISKTTDGGKTWTQVFDSKGEYYMNGISCADELNCMAVGENDNGFIVGTQDGGVTWNVVHNAPGTSLIAVKMLSATEAWASGGGENSRHQMVGSYFHTTDGGATWEVLTASGYAVDLSFNNGVGYSAAITSNYATMAIYK